MGFVFASIICSVIVMVLLKIAPSYRVEIGQAIVVNYIVAISATWAFLKPDLALLSEGQVPGAVFALLGFLLPTIFYVMAESIKQAGIVRSDAAQRLSLILPLIAAFFFFGERLTVFKVLGAALGLAALFGMIWREDGAKAEGSAKLQYSWPLIVFLGFGAIDILFKTMEATKLPFGTTLFVTFAAAFVTALLIELARRTKWSLRSAGLGVLIGTFNFGNILTYLQAHRALPDNPAAVFSGMNIGVVVVGTLVGVLGFKEQLTAINKAAIGLALVAILLLTAF